MILTYSNLNTAPLPVLASVAFAKSVAFIGDSRVYDAEYEWKNVTFADTLGLPLSVGFCTGQGITADSTGGGSLEYRASDANLRWTAPGDTAGPWTPMHAGWNLLESAEAGKGVRIGVRQMTGLPGTNRTVVVSVTGAPQNAWNAYGFGARMMNALRWRNLAPKFLGLGGNTSAQVIEQLPWLEQQASGPGYDVIQLGTNDISGSVAIETITANLTNVYDARPAAGRTLVLIGEPDRWGEAAGVPLTSEQRALLDGVNSFMASYAATHGCVFVDSFALTADAGSSDRRPASWVMRDHVHYSALGAQAIGEAAAMALAASVGFGPQRGSDDTSNLLGSAGFMAGTTGTASSAGVTGVAPTGWTVTRAIGTDATAAVSVSDRADGVLGRSFQIDSSAASGSNLIQTALGNRTLATLGLAVGDEVFIESEVDISDVVGGLIECDAYVLFTGASPATSLRCLRVVGTTDRQGPEVSIRRSPRMRIPAGTTGLRYFVWIRTAGSAAAAVRIASAAIVRVS